MCCLEKQLQVRSAVAFIFSELTVYVHKEICHVLAPALTQIPISALPLLPLLRATHGFIACPSKRGQLHLSHRAVWVKLNTSRVL